MGGGSGVISCKQPNYFLSIHVLFVAFPKQVVSQRGGLVGFVSACRLVHGGVCVFLFAFFFLVSFFVFFGCFSAYLGKSVWCVFLSRGWVGGVRFCVFPKTRSFLVAIIFLAWFWSFFGFVAWLLASCAYFRLRFFLLDGDSAVFGSCGRVLGFGRCISVCGRGLGLSGCVSWGLGGVFGFFCFT
jgi:hypothetical protein